MPSLGFSASAESWGRSSATFPGRLADKGRTRIGTGLFLFMALVSFAWCAWGATHLAGVIVGVLLLDFGVQGTQILNQSQIYRLGAAERSRLTAAYMTPYFIGGALGSTVSVLALRAFGWSGVCLVGAAFVGVALVHWFIEGITGNERSRKCA